MVHWVRRYYKDKEKAEKLKAKWEKEGWKGVNMYYYYSAWCVERLSVKEGGVCGDC